MLANEDRKRGKKRGKGRRGREVVNENFWFKKCDIINNCSENRYTGTGAGLQFFKQVPVPVHKSRTVPYLHLFTNLNRPISQQNRRFVRCIFGKEFNSYPVAKHKKNGMHFARL